MTKGTALVTGAALRLGRAIALGLAEKGYDLILHYNRSAAAAEDLADEIEQMGRSCQLFGLDFLQTDQIGAWMQQVLQQCPSCNLLVNSASIFEPAPFLTTEPEFFDRHLAVNLKAPFFLSQAFARHSQARHIINILDTKISTTATDYFVYTLTKKALFEFTRMAARELGPRIRVNGIGPGLILPPPGKDDAYLAEKARAIPLQQYGNPDQVVATLFFLLENKFITGECIFVDGGEHIH